jgi:glycosyltransferase involved in cell wall biosynthesis
VYVSAEAAISLFGERWAEDPRLRRLYYGIDLTPFAEPVHRVQLRERLGIPPDALVVGHVGRFHPQKNHAFLLEVAAAVRRIRPETHFLLVGDGPLQREIARRAEALGIADSVTFAGRRTDIAALMKGAMDVFLLPSRNEGLPLVLLEAQAAGLPFLASDAISRETDVVDGLGARMSLDESPEAWARGVLDAADRRIRYRSGEALKTLQAGPFEMSRSVEAMTAIYEAEVARSRRGFAWS